MNSFARFGSGEFKLLAGNGVDGKEVYAILFGVNENMWFSDFVNKGDETETSSLTIVLIVDGTAAGTAAVAAEGTFCFA